MDKKNEARIRDDRNRAAWYGVAQVEDCNLVHQKTSRMGDTRQGESDLIAPLGMEDADDGLKMTSIWPTVGKIAVLIAVLAFIVYFVVHIYYGSM